ncbi:uncharacterized protein LOC123213230 [Mangifera indica]|uniref:uncharacterized protein LOC123213230 n=1 Tax=Mangifera indica TaxID=29780 RepID=UPI001CFC3D65|nr:uncharacterized protein LOC123213230 [Mangifera indica]
MEALISQFTFLSDRACEDKNFDPSAIEDQMKLFEIEAYRSWAALEQEHEKEVKAAEDSMKEAEEYLESVMESCMDEYRRCAAEMESKAKREMSSLVESGEKARNMGKFLQQAATIASTKYIEAAMNSASASMKSAWKGVSSNRVHPS